ncbi:MAG: preprotein translocase subunit SecG [bacterium]
MTALLTFLFIMVSAGLILVILLQSSKGGGLAGAFGGGGDAMGAVFGGRGAANFLSKTTTWLAVGFLAIALLLSFLNKGGGDASQSLVGQEQQKRTTSTPASSLPLVPTGDSQGLLPVGSDQSSTQSDSAQ